ncbi:hypothetical protein AB0F13_21680 [Streptomyces sp. NPDC026206]|uniref:hypothetical protein n=1 Tax=Streptomyces sp. NPDC026206 TaxID=3157089 RepID=UPI0033ED01CD
MTARRARPPLRPYATLAGFVLLLAALFGVACAAGSAAGPAAPGMHRTGGGEGSGGSPGGGSGPGMGGMPGMGH